MHLSMKVFVFITLLELLLVIDYTEGRYLPTRGHGDNLEKLRELMYQILESSDENQNDQLQRLTSSYGGSNNGRHSLSSPSSSSSASSSSSPSWSKQYNNNFGENDLPQLFGTGVLIGGGGGGGSGTSTRSRYGNGGGNHGYDTERLYS